MSEVDDFLAHYGVKGMKWGVRRENRIASLERVASGTGSARDKLRSTSELSALNIARSGGYRNAAADKAQRMRDADARKAARGTSRDRRISSLERVASGTGTAGDKLRTATELSNLGVARSGGVANAAGEKAKRMRAVDQRIASGEGRARDYLSRYGGDRLSDLLVPRA